VAGLLARAIENREQSRTPSAPAEQTCYLIDRAILWVLYYGEDIKRFVEALNEVASNHRIRLQADAVALVQESFKPKYSGEGFPSAPWPVEGLRGPISADSKGLPLYTVMYGHLAVSCALIIAAFSARRKEEIVSLTDGCVSEVDGDYLLEVWIEKTLRHQQKVPVPAIVARAVETLQWLSMTHRKRTKEKWLFGFDTLIPFRGKSRLVGFGFPQVLREFAEYVGVPALPDGTYWHFTPHQFRRFFSIVYFYRYRYPSLSALSEYLRHFNPDTTRQYISEVSQGSFARLSEESKVDQDLWSVMQRDAQRNLDEISETSQEFKVEVLTEALNNPDKMRGFGGDKLRAELQKKLDEAENKFRIGSKPPDDPSRTLDEIIIAFANSCTIEPKGFGHSYCKCSTSQLDLEVAACVQEGQEGQDGKGPIVGPDNRFVADLTCSKCVHNVQLPENEVYWRDLIEKQLRLVKQAHAGLSGDVQKRRLDLATEHYERNFGPWEDRVRHEK
jgi:integrase